MGSNSMGRSHSIELNLSHLPILLKEIILRDRALSNKNAFLLRRLNKDQMKVQELKVMKPWCFCRSRDHSNKSRPRPCQGPGSDPCKQPLSMM